MSIKISCDTDAEFNTIQYASEDEDDQEVMFGDESCDDDLHSISSESEEEEFDEYDYSDDDEDDNDWGRNSEKSREEKQPIIVYLEPISVPPQNWSYGYGYWPAFSYQVLPISYRVSKVTKPDHVRHHFHRSNNPISHNFNHAKSNVERNRIV